MIAACTIFFAPLTSPLPAIQKRACVLLRMRGLCATCGVTNYLFSATPGLSSPSSTFTATSSSRFVVVLRLLFFLPGRGIRRFPSLVDVILHWIFCWLCVLPRSSSGTRRACCREGSHRASKAWSCETRGAGRDKLYDFRNATTLESTAHFRDSTGSSGFVNL